ncbi:hypothetical protein Tco_0265173 [Tanacetum coccineum]
MMKLEAVATTLHARLKFETQKGVAVVKGERFQPHDCSHVSQKRDHPEEASDTEGVERIIVNNAYPEQTLQITANLPKMLKEKLRELLCQNINIFAWKPADMTSIPRELAEHKLNIHPRTFPVWQKKRFIAKEQKKSSYVVAPTNEERFDIEFKEKKLSCLMNGEGLLLLMVEIDLRLISSVLKIIAQGYEYGSRQDSCDGWSYGGNLVVQDAVQNLGVFRLLSNQNGNWDVQIWEWKCCSRWDEGLSGLVRPRKMEMCLSSDLSCDLRKRKIAGILKRKSLT